MCVCLYLVLCVFYGLRVIGRKMGFQNTFIKNFYMGCGTETKYVILEDRKHCIKECKKFEFLGVKLDKEDRQENYILKIINKGREITRLLNDVE